MILVVEDDRDIREFLAELLGLEGFEVLTVSNGSEAQALLEQRPLPSLILLDLMMPQMDGWTLRELLLADEQLARIPVILLSGNPELKHHAGNLNVVAFFKKPFDMDELIVAIRALGPEFAGS